MVDRPILFSAPMVLALLAGTKTQTRRLLKPQPSGKGIQAVDHFVPSALSGSWIGQIKVEDTLRGVRTFITGERLRLPYIGGDRLWVREGGELLSYAVSHDPERRKDIWEPAGWRHGVDGTLVAKADASHSLVEYVDDCRAEKRPSIHMPRWASRLTLTVTDIRVQRLQEIGLRDARAEGCEVREFSLFGADQAERDRIGRIHYEALWTRINGVKSWDANPWVVAVTFSVDRRNIDAA